MRNLSKLLIFSCIVKKGSFTKAANDLGMSKSAVSQQIKILESELGVSLFRRNTRSFCLTSIGQRIFDRCQLLQDEMDLMLKDIDQEGKNPKGCLTITFPHALKDNVVIPAISQLCDEYPGLEPKLIVSDQPMDIINNNIDVAIYVGNLTDSSYRALHIGEMTDIFCSTQAYFDKASAPEAIESINDHRWISMPWQKKSFSIINTSNNTSKKVNLYRYAQVNALPVAVEMSKNDMGLILAPSIAVKAMVNKGELIHTFKDFCGPCWQVNMIHSYKGKKPLFITRFHQLVKSLFEEL